MDRRSWPWKKKSSVKSVTEKKVDASDSAGASLASVASLLEQENHKNVNYVQIPLDSYKHLTSLEDQVKTLEDQVKWLQDEVKDLYEKLSAAHQEMAAKDNLVQQQAKVAEEAVSGWEKADAEVVALKHQLESVTLLKLTAEDRASHLDGALKECMRQIRIVKDENEQKLHEVVLIKTSQWEKIRHDLEAQIDDIDLRLLRSAAENAALSRSLQEHSTMVMEINKQKSELGDENELLKGNILSYEKEISSLKYELHVASKELDIRNEEKNMSMRSAEAANKQHLEGVGKIAKLEAECQRLRNLVRKKLPGPAALAQMKQEVLNLGHDSVEPQPRRLQVKTSKSLSSSLPEFSLDKLQPHHNENELLTNRLLAMEEETKMLKEALATRNSELQSSREICDKMVRRLKNLETQQGFVNHHRSSPKSIFEIPTEGSLSQNASTHSVASMSEDGFDEVGSSAESWAAGLISDLHLKRHKSTDKCNTPANANSLELMDDFLEMERLACSANDYDQVSIISGSSNYMRTETAHRDNPVGGVKSEDFLQFKMQSLMVPSGNQDCADVEGSAKGLEVDIGQRLWSKLLSRISMILQSQIEDVDMRKALEDIEHAMHEMKNFLPRCSFNSLKKASHLVDVSHNLQASNQESAETTKSEILFTHGSKPAIDTEHIDNHDVMAAISHIHQFVISLGGKVVQVHDTSTVRQGLNNKFKDFSVSVDNFLLNKISIIDFVLDLSHVLAQAGELRFSIYEAHEGDITSSDCIDKVTLADNKVAKDDLFGKNFTDKWGHFPSFSSNPEVLQERKSYPGFAFNTTSCACSSEELEQLKLNKDNMVLELARCNHDLEITKLKLQESEQLLVELRSQLASSQRLYGLAETKLKCMAESYKSVEMRALELEAEVNLLRVEKKNLDNIMLQKEKRGHRDDLEEQTQRKELSICSLSPSADFDINTKQERELAAATAKLAECQETIYLLGRQLKSMHPHAHIIGSSSAGDKPCHG
ncbi:unnamed protein product [Ilex paraguariensis]|uniref:Filament-like plant protein 4 n=1 Tax=Ilex paraguariensis TaxID=185542 RepID=A0ABC8SIM4_9AQUA